MINFIKITGTWKENMEARHLHRHEHKFVVGTGRRRQNERCESGWGWEGNLIRMHDICMYVSFSLEWMTWNEKRISSDIRKGKITWKVDSKKKLSPFPMMIFDKMSSRVPHLFLHFYSHSHSHPSTYVDRKGAPRSKYLVVWKSLHASNPAGWFLQDIVWHVMPYFLWFASFKNFLLWHNNNKVSFPFHAIPSVPRMSMDKLAGVCNSE